MTYAIQETSVENSRPIELILIALGLSTWAFTTSEVPVVYNGITFQPIPMSRSNVIPTGDVNKSGLTVRLPMDNPVSELFRTQGPSGIVTATLWQFHYGDNDYKVIWKGRIINCDWQQPWAVMTIENVFSSLLRPGLRRKYSTQCSLALYSSGMGQCNVNKAARKITITVASVSGSTVAFNETVTSPLAGDYFAGGFIEWIDLQTGNTERRMLLASDLALKTITLNSIPLGLAAGMSLDMYPGCDHLVDTCYLKFNNVVNFGGFPFIPQKNPFKAMIY